METQIKACQCGRSYVHCVSCGRRNPYYKKGASLELTIQKGLRVDCYRCSCGVEFTSESECKAPPLIQKSGIRLEVSTNVWGSAAPGSSEHHILLNDWIKEHPGHGAIGVYIEAQKAGWHLEAFGDSVDPDVRQALIERGLWNSKDAGVTDQSGNANASVVAESPNETQASLDEIIKAMNEEQK